MLKYYCTKCHEISEYMERKVTVIITQPVSIDNKVVDTASELSRNISGSICSLCKAVLPMNPQEYIVMTIQDDDSGLEYVCITDIIIIHQNEDK